MSLIQFVRIRLQIANENPLFWANLVLLGLTIGFISLWPSPITEAGPSDFRLRAWAAFLQLTGAGIVFWDLTASARDLERPGVLANTFKWFKRLVKGYEVVSGTMAGSIVFSGKLFGRAGQPPLPPGAPLADRVKAIEDQITRIDGELSGLFKHIDETETKLAAQISEEASKREAAHKAIEETVKSAVIGNYASLMFGASWAVVGMVISAFSQDIARLGAGQWRIVWAYIVNT